MWFWIYTKVVYLQYWHGWCHVKLLPSWHILCTPYNHAPRHFIQSYIHKVHAHLAVTCHLHFWQNDLDLLHATAVTQGWYIYQNKSQHRKLTLEKKILPPLLRGLKSATFQSWVWHCNHWAIPACARKNPSLRWLLLLHTLNICLPKTNVLVFDQIDGVSFQDVGETFLMDKVCYSVKCLLFGGSMESWTPLFESTVWTLVHLSAVFSLVYDCKHHALLSFAVPHHLFRVI